MPATLIDIADAVLARLATGGITVVDQDVAATPPGPYVIVMTDGGLATVDSLAGTARSRLHTVTVMCVGGPGGTTSACRDLADRAHALLAGWQPVSDAALLRQAGTGPVLTSGPPGDRRHSLTLTYQTHA